MNISRGSFGKYYLLSITIEEVELDYMGIGAILPTSMRIEMSKEQISHLILKFDLSKKEKIIFIRVEDLRIPRNIFRLTIASKIAGVTENDRGNIDLLLDYFDDSFECGKILATCYSQSKHDI